MKPILFFVTLILATLCIAGFTSEKIVDGNKSGYNAPLFLQGFTETMRKPSRVTLQYILPQRALSNLAGWLANSERPWLKNYLIRYFLNRFTVDMSEAIVANPYDYPSFNAFFTRQLKPERRPIVQGATQIASPADGFISQIGSIQEDTLLQAKGFHFTLVDLLGGSEKRAAPFKNGAFATIYLAPKDYHRVHMPFTGKLRESIFIPGKLFSVDPQTTTGIPNLFARNERLVCIFDTSEGPMAVIMVGAMLVGSMETVWHAKTQSTEMIRESYAGSLQLSRGAEMGYFKMGSTVIILFGKDKATWAETLHPDSSVRMGEEIGTLSHP